MKKLLLSLTTILFCATAWAEPQREFRATWFTTHYAIDWPTAKVTTTGNAAQIAAQQKEMTDILDDLVEGNMNAFCFQARPLSDAYYKSSYEPWGVNLTNIRGKDPGYDPLAYAIQEGHKRGLEVHVWVNPFRVTVSGTVATTDKVWENCKDWIIKYDNGSFSGQIIDPGFPEARAYVIKVLMEIINNYDIDGIIMDDYFYPYGGTTTEDATSKGLYKPEGMSDGDWRRSNVDKAVKALYDSIQSVKPWVRFGMGPFGIWTTQKSVAASYGISLPTGITGLDDYEVQACNPVEWVKGGYVDYIAPQLYWSSQIAAQSYSVLCKWWGDDVCRYFSAKLPGDQRVDFFVSQAAYHAYPEKDGSYYRGYDDGVIEIQRQIDYNRQYDAVTPGSIFYNTKAYQKMHNELKASHFTYKALPPAMDWKATTTLAAPSNLSLSGTTLSWTHTEAERFTVYAYPKGTDMTTALSTSQYLLGVAYGKSYDLSVLSGIDNYTIAVRAYDRFGVEYTPALYNEAKSDITWVLNGGTVSVPVPTNAGLWETFMPYYNTYYAGRTYIPRSTQTIDKVSTFANAYMQEIMTDATSEYKWLGDYVYSVATAQGYTLSTSMDNADESAWRWTVHAFFNCSEAGSLSVKVAGFTTAGQPSAWGSAYQLAHGGVILPSSVSETYTLPTPTKEGETFLGWYDNPSFSGSPLITIPAGYTGTLYARWSDSAPSNVSDVSTGSATGIALYDTMGRYVGKDISVLGHGVFIITSNTNTSKIIL